MNKLKLSLTHGIIAAALAFPSISIAEECSEETMDAFAYEDCIKAKNGGTVNEADFGGAAAKASEKEQQELNTQKATEKYQPFGKEAYLTSSFGENRGTRYHAGLDYSTNMEEGWPIFAPEDGKVKELRVSPFGYGKVMFYQGKSGKTWVFAHQSSFGDLDDAIAKQQYATKKNDVTVKPGRAFKKGDTLTYAGSSGIGNPHLHLEVRLDNDRVVNPRIFDTDASDTIAPQVLGAALWQGNELSLTSAEAIDKGCIVSPVKNEFNVNLAVKIVDYSRTPKDNPMSVRRISMWRYDDKIFEERMDTLRFSKMLQIRDQLLWAEEADTAGDWHFINTKIAPISNYTLEVEDFAGNVTTKKFTFRNKCTGNKSFPLTKVQTSPVFTFLSRPMLDLFRCESGMKFSVLKGESVLAENLCSAYRQENRATPLGKIFERYPEMTGIRYTADAASTGDGKAIDEVISVFGANGNQSNVNWSTSIGDVNITQKITGAPITNDTTKRVLAVTRTHTDSLDFFEFHPKGMQLKNWNVCIENKENPAPLYWLGETSRNWFIFSKQTKGKGRCASTNELRDIASIDNQEPIALGFPYWDAMMIGGTRQPALKIPLMFKYDGVEDGNAITVLAGKKWIAAEYDSEPREIIIEGEKLPDAGETITLQIKDEAGRKLSYNIVIPEM
ncbi:MAG: M23 family metallopeptidase [Fibrobacter sp.]|nr:M23 family metallopeptidase [Fibrobacter sp.]